MFPKKETGRDTWMWLRGGITNADITGIYKEDVSGGGGGEDKYYKKII